MSNARAQFNAEEEIRTQSIACEGGRRPGKDATQMHVTLDRIMLPRTPHAEDLGPLLFSIASA